MLSADKDSIPFVVNVEADVVLILDEELEADSEDGPGQRVPLAQGVAVHWRVRPQLPNVPILVVPGVEIPGQPAFNSFRLTISLQKT